MEKGVHVMRYYSEEGVRRVKTAISDEMAKVFFTVLYIHTYETS